MVWPHGGSPSDLIASIEERLNNYRDASKKIVVFDKYLDVSAKDHERMRRASEVVIDYDISITSHLPKRDAIMKSKSNKRKLASVLGTFDLGESTTMETRDDCAFLHDEADVTMVSFVLEAAKAGQGVVRVLSDDTDVFVLLVYWVHRANLLSKVQLERWDGSVLDINATCANLGQKCLQLLGMHALSGCDTTSYPYGKGKVTALNTMISGNYQGLATVGDVGTTQAELMTAAMSFFIALYGQPQGTSMEAARFALFAKKKKNPKVMALPPTSANLMQHILRAHLQVMLWKAADCKGPPDESTDITKFGWVYRDGIPTPVIAEGDPAPPELLDVIRCQCKAQGKKCSTDGCGCHKHHLSCTTFCNCHGGEDCLNQFTTVKDIGPAAEEDPDTEDINDTLEDDAGDELEQDKEVEDDIAGDPGSDYLENEWE